MLPKVTTVTSAALRDMAIGESRTFKLPDHEPYLSRAVNNGKSRTACSGNWNAASRRRQTSTTQHLH